MTPILIGIAGRARSGKDTAAQHLVNNHGFQAYAFADPLRDGLMHMLNLSPCDLDDEKKEQPISWLGKSPRELMQLLGTEWGRDMVHPDLWMLLAEQNLDLIARTHDTAKGFVVTDLRFNNEADFIRKRGGVVVHMDRATAPTVAAHSSENGIWAAPGDLWLPNDGTFDELFTNVDNVVDKLLTRAAAA
ncbi:deoxynucleotide monophosphate kinase [Pseudomonas brassicacearum]|uniref:deoxynucleotide monophosphate kinase family protein n=1 Tax=Pseudomonas brassicacearum TaxID=930166 RepID=UPI003D6BF8E4